MKCVSRTIKRFWRSQFECLTVGISRTGCMEQLLCHNNNIGKYLDLHLLTTTCHYLCYINCMFNAL